jgi:hypothetical protein
MVRRSFVSAMYTAMLVMGLAMLLGKPAQAQPRYTVSAAQLQQMVVQQFPRRYPVAGLMNMDVQAPVLRLLPAMNRLSAEMAVEATGLLLDRSQKGMFEVDFALRYEASDRTIRAHQLRFTRLRMANLSPAGTELINAYGPAMAEQTLQEVVLHQLSAKDLAVTDDLGLQPSSITVTESGLVVGFETKPLR